jgi:eukaryotic-like serine/threonine-protein kinase
MSEPSVWRTLPKWAASGPNDLIGRLESIWRQGQRPDVDDFLAGVEGLSASGLAAVLRVDQQHRWQAGERVGAEDYLRRYPALRTDNDAAVDLVYSEFLLRERSGEQPDAEDFLRRFPDYAEILKAQIDLHRAVTGPHSGLTPTDAETLASAAVAAAKPARPSIPGYEILEELGRGGMGVVYKARQTQADRVVALKMILSGALASAAETQRFRTEAEAAARLDHPHLVPLHEIGEYAGQPFFTMKWIDGGSLGQHLARFTADPRAAARLVATVARAVHHAHQRGIIHRDLKPANILLDADSQPHVTDFGLARRTDGDSGLTQSGAIVGTPSYMAPEQAAGRKGVTTAVDVYSLGAILYELLTGRPPFRAETPLDTLMQVLERQPEPPRAVNPKVDRDLELVCLKCLSKEPVQRYGSAEALAAELEHWAAGEPVTVRPPSLGVLMRLWLRQNFGAAGWTVVVGLTWGLLTGAVIWLVRIYPILRPSAGAYAYLPHLTPSPLAFRWAIPVWLQVAVFVPALLAACGMGLFTALLVRPRSRAADVAAGLVAGLLGAITAFTVTGGWVAVMAWSVLPADEDLALLARSAWPVEAAGRQRPSDRLLEKYPDLRELPPGRRSAVLYHKLRSDLLTGIPAGMWLGMLACLGLGAAVGVSQTLAAGRAVRRHGASLAAVPPYLEVAFPATILIALLSRVAWHLYIGWFTGQVWFLLVFGCMALAIVGAVRGWHWSVRVGLQLGWFAAGWLVAGNGEFPPG